MKRRIATKREPTSITALQLDDQFLVFFLESFQHIGIQDDAKIVHARLILAHNRIECAMQFHARGLEGFPTPAPPPSGPFSVIWSPAASLGPLCLHSLKTERGDGNSCRLA